LNTRVQELQDNRLRWPNSWMRRSLQAHTNMTIAIRRIVLPRYPGHIASVSIPDPLQTDTADNLGHRVRERGTGGLRLFTTTETEGT